MAEEKTRLTAPEKARPQVRVKLHRFEAPLELDAKILLQTQEQNHVSGLVKPEDVRYLLDAFGLQKRTEIVFPFQHMERDGRDLSEMLIQPPAMQQMDSGIVMAHQWTYQRNSLG